MSTALTLVAEWESGDRHVEAALAVYALSRPYDDMIWSFVRSLDSWRVDWAINDLGDGGFLLIPADDLNGARFNFVRDDADYLVTWAALICESLPELQVHMHVRG